MVLDYETRSAADVGEVGAFEYSMHAEVLCFSWRRGTFANIKDQKTQVWAAHRSAPYGDFIRGLLDPNVLLIAHNALFEQVITRNALTKIMNRPGLKEIPIERWACTASFAAALALPRSLEEAGAALGLTTQKDKTGKALIRRHCIPQKLSKKMRDYLANGLGLEPWQVQIDDDTYWNNDPEGLDDLARYCGIDTDTEVELLCAIPHLSPESRKYWIHNQRMNLRGVHVDREAVKTVLRLVDQEASRLQTRVPVITGGELQNATQRAAVLTWLEGQGLTLPNLQAKTVADALSSGLVEGKAKELLEIRQAVSKTSIGKYEAFEARTRHDGRLRDYLLFHGASTGRDTGAGVQPHNFPRGHITNMNLAVDILKTGDLELVRALLGAPIEAFSGCLRGMIAATPGKTLYAADFSAIEARMVNWLAGHEAGLKGFVVTKGVSKYGIKLDAYSDTGAAIYDISLDDVTKAIRELGKRAELGCGFGMGWPKFQETCKNFGIELSDELAQKAVTVYRSTHQPVVKMWGNYERAAIAAVRDRRKAFKINRTKWFMGGDFLFCELPSGRCLAYYKPEIRMVKTPWGDKRPALYHWDIHPKTHQWLLMGTYGGKLTENVVQGSAADIMKAAAWRTEEAGFHTLITVHDEVVSEHNEAGRLEEFERLMSVVPDWAPGFPVKVEGFEAERYRK